MYRPIAGKEEYAKVRALRACCVQFVVDTENSKFVCFLLSQQKPDEKVKRGNKLHSRNGQRVSKIN